MAAMDNINAAGRIFTVRRPMQRIKKGRPGHLVITCCSLAPCCDVPLLRYRGSHKLT